MPYRAARHRAARMISGRAAGLLTGERRCGAVTDQRTGEPGHHHGVVDRGAHVGDPHLDRLVSGRRPGIPVDAGGIIDAAGRHELPDDLVVLGP